MSKFGLIVRHDGKIALFCPAAKQSIVADKTQFQHIFTETNKFAPEIMPREIYSSIGLSFGEISLTNFKRIISIAKKIGCEIIE